MEHYYTKSLKPREKHVLDYIPHDQYQQQQPQHILDVKPEQTQLPLSQSGVH